MNALISQREDVDKYGVPIDSLESSYISYFESLGCNLFPVSNYIKNVEYLFEQNIQLLILTGGGSVSGNFYYPAKTECNAGNRDFVEKQLFEKAVKENIPILAICRGMQYINGLLGGNISVLSNLPVPRQIGAEHPVYFGHDIIHVNNYHNDGIYLSQLAKGLTAIGVDTENQIVECYISQTPKILAMQFHPERGFSDLLSQKRIKKIIQDFIENKNKE